MKNALFIFLLFIICIHAYSQQPKGVILVGDTSITEGTVRAVIIGISDYKNVQKLNYAHSDAQLFYDYLINSGNDKIKKENVVLLLNEKATAGQIISALDWLVDETKEGDLVYFYFSGHGDLEKKTVMQHGFLLAYDSPTAAYMAGGTIGIGYLQSYLTTLSKNKAKVVAITDACRSGKLAGGEEGSKQTVAALQEQWENVSKILSSQVGELSFESKAWGKGGGVFSYYLIEGLRGFADRNHDSKVNLSEMNIYLSDNVPKETNYSQNPFVAGNLTTTLSLVKAGSLVSNTTTVKNSNISKDVKFKGFGDDYKTKLDSTTYSLYINFQTCLSEGNLIKNPKKSEFYAWNMYQQVKERPQGKIVINNMKRSLVAALQDKSQTLINQMLVEERRIFMENNLIEDSYQELDLALKLIDTTHILYRPINARFLFLKSSKAKNSKEELKILNECLSNDPDASYGYYYLGLCYRDNNDIKSYKDGIVNFNKAIDLTPKWSQPYCAQGVTYYLMKDYEKAIPFLLKAIEINSGNLPAYNYLGNAYFWTKDFRKAERIFDELLLRDSNFGSDIYKTCQFYSVLPPSVLKKLTIGIFN